MKATLYSPKGENKGSVELPGVFDTVIREDIIARCFEAEKFSLMQPYTHDPEGGKKSSASGTISHKRHEWKGHYGKGISRTPRKTMWRRGTQFYWVASEVSHVRGGRAAHGPTGLIAPRKINKKEFIIARNTGIAATANPETVVKRYASLSNIKGIPVVLESVPTKTKDFITLARNVFGDAFSLVLKKKSVRSGKGKSRNRTYKSTAGLILITGNKEKVSLSGVDVIPVNALKIADLYPLGRLAIYTKQALENLK